MSQLIITQPVIYQIRFQTDGRVFAEASYRLNNVLKFSVGAEDGRQVA